MSPTPIPSMTDRTASVRRRNRRPSTSSRQVWPQSIRCPASRARLGRSSVMISRAEPRKVTASAHSASDSWLTFKPLSASKPPSQVASPAIEAKMAEPTGNVP